MFLYLFIFFIIILFFILIKNKVKVKWKTFLHKGFKPNRGIFGIYCYCGKQGSGKTYSVIEFLNNNKDKKIYANMKSIKGIDYTYIKNFDELLELRKEENCIIFYDEIFTALTKSSKINTDVLDFLSQMRKRKIIFLTTAQEWAEIPLTFRRYCRYQINCKLYRIPFINGILIKNFMDAENMKWSSDDNDFVAPLIENSVSHTMLSIARSYDTFEQVGYNSNSSDYSQELSEEEESQHDSVDDISILFDDETKLYDTPLDELNLDSDFWGDDIDDDFLLKDNEEEKEVDLWDLDF